MAEIIKRNISDLEGKQVFGKGEYEYNKKTVVPREENRQITVAVYEIPPLKSAYPYHHHTASEEMFYIISGEGVLRTETGEQTVGAGDIIYFPANEKGAHKLTNLSDENKLVYIDVDTCSKLDVCHYPDSNKIGVWGMGINKLFKFSDEVDYYEGE